MAIKIERMDVKNQQRGQALLLARFDVNFGPMSVKGFEMVKVGDKVFISEPYNLWKPKDAPYDEKPKKFTYVWFNGEAGKKVQAQITELAKDEFRRRANAPVEREQNAWDGDVFGGGGGGGGGDGLPF